MSSTPAISVVIGSKNARATIREVLRSVTACATEAEVIVADASSDGTAAIIEQEFPAVRLLRGSARALVPELWGLAIGHAAGPLVAITTAHCIPAPGWVDALVAAAAARPEHAGLGGPIDPPREGSPVEWAVYFARYSAYVPPLDEGVAAEIPGDNAVYRREALDRAWSDRKDGFWETLVHRSLHAQGATIAIDGSIRVRSASAGGPSEFFVSRLRHGMHYGSTRLLGSNRERLARAVTTPLVVPQMLLRIVRRVRSRRPEWLGRLAVSFPWLVLFLTGWALGEMAGLLRSRRPR